MKVDLLIKNAFVFQTYRQVFEKKDIAIIGDKIVRIADSLTEYEIKAYEILDRRGKYIIPGFVDVHMHIESSMTYPAAFSQAALSYGTTSVVADPHEIANVFGRKGIEAFLAQQTQLDIFYGIPSCVPSTNETIETSGAELSLEDIEKLLKNDRVLCLGEVMNFHEITAKKRTKIQDILALCRENKRHIKIEGHCPKLSEEELAQFIVAGVDSDHTQQTAESLLQKIDAGFFIELQKKSITKEVIEIIKKYHLYESIAFVTDDVMPDELKKGHLNQIIQRAIDYGMDFEKALYCGTYTPARRMQLYDRGSLAPGKMADFMILENKNLCGFMEVYKSGARIKKEREKVTFPKEFFHSVLCKKAIKEDFEVKIEEKQLNNLKKEYKEKTIKEVFVRVIKTSKQGTFTTESIKKVELENSVLKWEEAGLTLITIFERHGKTNQISHAFLEPGLKVPGAVATTWSHDSHNLLVLGNSKEAMVRAQNQVVLSQGGYCVSNEKNITAFAPLEIGGILATQPVDELGEQIRQVRDEITKLGYENQNVIMSISTLALVVSPNLKITDKGLFDVKEYQFKPLIIDKGESTYDSYN